MTALRVAVVAGLVGGVGWLAKIVIMALQGGPDLDSVPETVAFVTGLVGVLVGSAAVGAHLTRGRGWGWRILAAAAAVGVAVLVVGFGQELLTALPGDGWLQEEAIFGIVGLLAVVAAAVALLGPGRTRPER